MLEFNSVLRNLLRESMNNFNKIEALLQSLPSNRRKNIALSELRELTSNIELLVSSNDPIDPINFRLDRYMVRFLDSIDGNNFGEKDSINMIISIDNIVRDQFKLIEIINTTMLKEKLK